MRKKKIRVMHLIYQLGAGGAENGIINIANYIDKKKFDIAVCAFANNGSRVSHLDKESDYFCMNKTDGNDLILPFNLAGLFRHWKPHIVHTHAWGTLAEGFFASKLARVPVIIHGEHGTIQQKKANLYVQNLLWRLCDTVLSVSTEHRKQLSKLVAVPENRIKVIHNGVDSGFFLPKNEKFDFKKKIILGTIGRLVPVKNHTLLIEAVKRISEIYQDIELVIVGEGPLEKELTIFSKRTGIFPKINFTGKRFDIPEVLKTFDIFILPSLSEGMSNTVLEAMSCGIPVIAANVGGNSELIQHHETGILFESNNLEQLIDNIMFLINNPEIRKKYGIQARKRIENNFTIEQMIKNYEQLYINTFTKKYPRNHADQFKK